jgi:hypothetical protein
MTKENRTRFAHECALVTNIDNNYPWRITQIICQIKKRKRR